MDRAMKGEIEMDNQRQMDNAKETKRFTEVEEALISVIDNFILWYSTESDRGIVEEYMGEEHVDYNDWFELKKEKNNGNN